MTGAKPNRDLLVAQITDLHIGFHRDDRHELNVRRLNLVIDYLNDFQPRPSLLLVTGDLVEFPDDEAAYRHVKALIGRFEGPVMFALGNHDGRALFTKIFPEVPADGNGFIQHERDHGGLRWIVLDTLDEGRHGGMLCEQRIGWLKARLAERTGDPTVVILHHPPVDTGIDWMSALSCEGWVERLHEVVEPAAQIVGMIAGHVHRPIATLFAGKTLAVCDSTAPGLALDLDSIDPAKPDGRALILADEPGVALHYWNGERLLTHFESVGPRNVVAVYDSNLQSMIRDFIKERGTG